MDEKEIERVMQMLDAKCEQGVSRIKVETSDDIQENEVKTQYHHGRCDIGSPFAKGMKNISCD